MERPAPVHTNLEEVSEAEIELRQRHAAELTRLLAENQNAVVRVRKRQAEETKTLRAALRLPAAVAPLESVPDDKAPDA